MYNSTLKDQMTGFLIRQNALNIQWVRSPVSANYY
jgi:hypothetical protein